MIHYESVMLTEPNANGIKCGNGILKICKYLNDGPHLRAPAAFYQNVISGMQFSRQCFNMIKIPLVANVA